MTFSIGQLGVLSPAMQGQVEDRLATLNVLEQQVVNDLVLVGRQGANVGGVTAQLDLASEQILTLDAQTLTMADADAAAWHAEVDRVEATLRSLLDDLGSLRERLQEGQRFIGLWWGLGVSAAAATVAWFVWKKRRRRRGGR